MAGTRSHAGPAAPAGPPIAPPAPRGFAVRFLSPEPPPLAEVAPYYRLSEQAGFYANDGPCARMLATRLAAFVGDGAGCVPVASCTAGLLLAIRAVFGPPDGRRTLVATPSYTFTATACVIRWCGFEPLFVDVDADGWQMDPIDLERALAAHDGEIAGVLGCSTFGTAAPSDVLTSWKAACERRRVPLVIDSAAGFGSEDDLGRRLGSRGLVEVFSFHATKPFAVGEGGAVLTPDPDTADTIQRLANFGLEPGTRVTQTAGINGKMSELAAATGCAMADRYERVLVDRRATAEACRARLAGLPVRFQAGSERSTMQIHQVTLPDRRSRDAALGIARDLRVEARSYFDPPLHRHPAFSTCPRTGDLPVTEHLAARSLSLPMANRMEEWQMDRVAEVVSRATRRRVRAA
ncbi:MAG: aminotransferase class I/II-fold pyridoxal phosphate-dependent enzyme [Actinomycetota bacterium]